MLQNLVVAILVLACGGYVAWTLMPAALRARLAGRPVPAGGCGGCSGCGPAKACGPASAQPVRIVRRPPSA